MEQSSLGLLDILVYGSFFTLCGRYYARAVCEFPDLRIRSEENLSTYHVLTMVHRFTVVQEGSAFGVSPKMSYLFRTDPRAAAVIKNGAFRLTE
jgi:hypothetical protein